MNKKIVYILLSKKQSISTNQKIYIKDIAKVNSKDPKLKKSIENLNIYKSKKEENWDFINTYDITEKIEKKYKDVDINLLGPPEVLLEIKSPEKSRPIIQFFKILSICIILFLGSGIAIVNFHEDVNMEKSIEKIYYTVTGEKKSKPKIITIPYSIGIGIGVITFFSRIISKSERRNKEPGPMEIELFLYNKDMEEYILNDLSNEDKDNV